MKKLLFTVLCLCLAGVAVAQSSDEAAIKNVVTSAYIEGILNRGSVDEIRKGIHPSFNMLRMIDNNIKPLPIEEWIVNLEKAKKENPKAQPRAEGKFISVDITGTAAVVKLELSREGKITFTDYIVLYKFTEGWRIVSKTFYRHP